MCLSKDRPAPHPHFNAGRAHSSAAVSAARARRSLIYHMLADGDRLAERAAGEPQLVLRTSIRRSPEEPFINAPAVEGMRARQLPQLLARLELRETDRALVDIVITLFTRRGCCVDGARGRRCLGAWRVLVDTRRQRLDRLAQCRALLRNLREARRMHVAAHAPHTERRQYGEEEAR